MTAIQEQTRKDKVTYDGVEYDIPLYVVVYPGTDTQIVRGQITAIVDMTVGHRDRYDPRIYLEDGSLIYGHSCWWAPSTKLEEFKELLTSSGYEYEIPGELKIPRYGEDRCWLAIKAAWDTIAEQCDGKGVRLDMDGISITVPVGIMDMGTHRYMSSGEHIKEIAQTAWCRETALKICKDVFGCTTDKLLECIDSVAIRIATRIVG